MSGAAVAATEAGHPMTALAIVADALDQALARQVIHLFEVLVVASDLNEGFERFERGLKKAVDAYELVKDGLEEE